MTTTRFDAAQSTAPYVHLAAAIAFVVLASNAWPTFANEAAPAGRLDFEAAKLPEANVEVDLSENTIGSLFAVSDAAIAGVAETLFKVGDGDKDAKPLTAAQLDAVRKIVELGGKFVRECRFRLYEGLPEGTDDAASLLKSFDAQLKAGKWETVARIRNDNGFMRVSMLHKDGSIRGVFVMTSDGDAVAIGNIVCDISPEHVKPLTAAITKIGMSADFQPTVQWVIAQATESDEPVAVVGAGTLSPATAAVPNEKAKK